MRLHLLSYRNGVTLELSLPGFEGGCVLSNARLGLVCDY